MFVGIEVECAEETSADYSGLLVNSSGRFQRIRLWTLGLQAASLVLFTWKMSRDSSSEKLPRPVAGRIHTVAVFSYL